MVFSSGVIGKDELHTHGLGLLGEVVQVSPHCALRQARDVHRRMLHASIQKTQQTPPAAIERATQRCKEWPHGQDHQNQPPRGQPL